MREPRSRHDRLRAVMAVAVTGALAAGGLALLGGSPGTASSHREAPQILGDPQADNTDTYAFRSPDKKDTVTLLANWYPFQEPNGGPNFYPFAENARYNIHVDNSGDGKPDVTYRWEFRDDDKRKDTFLYNNGPVKKLKDDTLLFKQKYTLTAVKGDEETVLIENGTAAPSFTGKASMPNYGKLQNQGTRDFDEGKGKAYAGAADDSFFLDLRVFDLLYGGDLSETGQDTLTGYNVNTLAVQVPRDAVALEGDAKDNPVIGVWSTTERLSTKITDADEADAAGGEGGEGGNDEESKNAEESEEESEDSGSGICIAGVIGCETRGTNKVREGKRTATVDTEWVQVSRLGHPLINEVIASAPLKDAFNGLEPSQDGSVPALVDRVTKPEVPALIEAIYGIKAPNTPRKDLVQIFLTGIAKGNGPVKADLNAHSLNKDADEDSIVPAEMLRLNMSVPVTKWSDISPLGVLGGDLQGFPNGRRLGDDVVDIELQALVGAAKKGKLIKALAAGDGVNENNRSFDNRFPYIAKPNEKGVNRY